MHRNGGTILVLQDFRRGISAKFAGKQETADQNSTDALELPKFLVSEDVPLEPGGLDYSN